MSRTAKNSTKVRSLASVVSQSQAKDGASRFIAALGKQRRYERELQLLPG